MEEIQGKANVILKGPQGAHWLSGERSINGVIRLAGFLRATEGRSASLGGVRESTLVKVILEISKKRQAGFHQASYGGWRETR